MCRAVAPYEKGTHVVIPDSDASPSSCTATMSDRRSAGWLLLVGKQQTHIILLDYEIALYM